MSDAKENEDFIKNCLESGWCEMDYEDDEARILKIREQKSEPPSSEEEEEEANEENTQNTNNKNEGN
jgi:hypothetical protein